MRHLLFIISVLSLSSCSLIRQTAAREGTATVSLAQAIEHNRQPRKFLDDISVTPEKTRVNFVAQVDPTYNTARGPYATTDGTESNATTREANRSTLVDPTKLTGLQIKYTQLLGVASNALPSLSLLLAIEEWYGTPYRWGGTTKGGIDCSAFTQAVYFAVYGVLLPRVSRDQHRSTRRITLTDLQEGDLVFFNTRGRGVSHVGIYLGNNKFAHASSEGGVMVSDLYDKFYVKRFLGAGRWLHTSGEASTTLRP